MKYSRIASYKTYEQMSERFKELELSIPFEKEVSSGSDSPLQQPIAWKNQQIGNRFCILPMEGWDGTPDGKPSDLTYRRWKSFGASGAKLIWGGEAVAVRHDGRANPNQLLITDRNLSEIEELRQQLVQEHEVSNQTTSDLVIGLQLTHSGRYSRPDLEVGPATSHSSKWSFWIAV